MRIISIGCPVPNPSVDNHSIANAPSFFDYDACIIDLQSVSDQIEGIAAATLDVKSPDGRAIGTGESGAFHYGLAELLQQRQLELQLLLDRGGLIVLFLYPNVRHNGVASFPGLTRYSLIPSPAADPFRWPTLRPADGRHTRPTNLHHPASGYLDDLSGRLRYRAILDLPPASEGVVVGRSVGGAAVAAEFRLGPGRIVALPAADQLSTAQRKVFTSALLEMIERLTYEPDPSDAPVWARRFDTPEADSARDELSVAQQEIKQAQRRLTEAKSLLADATRFQSMLWQSQNAALVETIQDAFRMLGYSPSMSDGAMELRNGDETALVEISSANGAVSDRLYLTLQNRIEEHFLKRQQRPKGIIVANGFRETDPRIRREPFPKTLVNACETYGYALIPAEALFELVTFAVEASDEPEALADIRQSIADTAGVIEVTREDDLDDDMDEAPTDDIVDTAAEPVHDESDAPTNEAPPASRPSE